MSDRFKTYRGEHGRSIARDTLEMLAQFDIPTHPENYEIWATFKAEEHPDLCREIKRLMADGHAFTEDVNAGLFEKYFTDTRLSMRIVDASEAFAAELSDVSTSIRKTGAETAHYADGLRKSIEKVRSTRSVTDFEEMLTEIAAKTNTIAQNNAQLAIALNHSLDQVERLTADLEAARTAALTDGLTGLANRRMLDTKLLGFVADAQGGEAALSLFVCDIDHFKRVNDRWGHDVGDHVIRFVAAKLRSLARPGWLAARFGGEEFVLVMPGMTAWEAEKIATQLLGDVGSRPLRIRNSGDVIGRVTLSIGVAEYRPGETADYWFRRADTCLFNAKAGGRNQVLSEPAGDVPGRQNP
ncbi:GGDEF domain-containing protein [Hyphomonas sp.]|uniref:GGDEF domain-containing protein n=1 Tax=Hyphomonas sp. TaxID=87 RepID=UPI003526CC70